MSLLTLRPPYLIFVALAWCVSSLAAAPIPVAENVFQVGSIQAPAIDESSGMIASRSYPGVFWTHNDSDEWVFSITKKGVTLGDYVVNGVKFLDFEDIAADGAGNLYLGDIGDDNTLRTTIAVYKVREPNPYSSGAINVLQRYNATFPGTPGDCESLFIYKGYGYVITKERNVKSKVTVYRFPLSVANSTLEFVTRVGVTSKVTAADISRDKTRLALLTEQGAYCFYINGDVFSLRTASYVFTPFINDFMEGACFAGNGLLVSAETRQLYLFNHEAFRTW